MTVTITRDIDKMDQEECKEQQMEHSQNLENGDKILEPKEENETEQNEIDSKNKMSQGEEEEEDKDKEQRMEGIDISDSTNRVLESQEINETERRIIKGDTIGETLYSAKWILKTLISLTNVYENGWNESMEKDLCILWDMSQEKDIVKYLLENDFFKMAEFTLKISQETRLTEIVVGIIGNMCCETEALESLVNTNELATLVLSLISSDDPETVIQVLRVFQAALWDVQKNLDSPWLKKIKECATVGEAITFILKNSLVDDLMIPTIEIIYLISEMELPNDNYLLDVIFDVDQLISALSESMIKIIDQENNPHTNSQLKNIENWYSIIFNTIKKELLKLSDDENNEDYQNMNTVLLKILKPYTMLSNLMLSDDRGLLCIQQCIRMVYFFQKNELIPNLGLIQTIIKIMLNLKSAASTEHEFEDSDHEYFKELHTYSTNYWVEVLKIFNKDQIVKVLQRFDDRDLDAIIELTKTLSKISKESMGGFFQACIEVKAYRT
ncbi:uncharacterized protein LOC100119375 [Nasonia vitripennis]|uniref:Protein saal1 n=1 Tax=Nasonia vitripennis TaxID=7425 RepID=A0A7M7G4K1_NASVI|nr:uncharacterized protein LOC100119375 [Nasonia vitripennis]